MSQMMKLVLAFVGFLTAVTLLHGAANHKWFESRVRERLVVGHLPVT